MTALCVAFNFAHAGVNVYFNFIFHEHVGVLSRVFCTYCCRIVCEAQDPSPPALSTYRAWGVRRTQGGHLEPRLSQGLALHG